MKTTLLSSVLVLVFLLNIPLHSQSVSCNYIFSQHPGVYSEITGGTVLAAVDDESFGPIPIGFTFYFNGNPNTSVGIQSNGFICMCGSAPPSNIAPISTGATNSVICALGQDLHFVNGGTLRYQTVGSPGSQVLIVQWKNVRHYNNTSDQYNFQIKLFEGINSIQIIYGHCTITTAITNQVGLRGISNADFSNRSAASGVNAWESSVAGTVNTATCDLQTGFGPPDGLTYEWSLSTPVLVSPPNGSINIQPTPTLTWNAIPGVSGYEVQISADSLFSATLLDINVTVNQLTVPSGVLAAPVKYFWRVRSLFGSCHGLWSTRWSFTTTIGVGISILSSMTPDAFRLYNNYPNPFNPSTKLRFDIPVSTYGAMSIFDVLGRLVYQASGHFEPGTYEFEWNAGSLASGLYIYKIETPVFTESKKMLLTK